MKISTRPLTDAQTEKLLSSFPPVVCFVTTYRVSNWYNKRTNEILYGVQMKKDGEWVNVCYGDRALFFKQEATAKLICKHLKGATSREKNRLKKMEVRNGLNKS
jgi:hypothetical protein